MQEDAHKPDPDSADKTPGIDPDSVNPNQSIGNAGFAPPGPGESLFESYDRRSLRSIIEQQRAYRDSQAAQAARTILDGVEIPEYDTELEEVFVYEDETDERDSGYNAAQPKLRKIRVQRISTIGRLASPGAQIIYVLLVVAALGGTLGLAFSTDSPHLLMIAGIATPMLMPICVWRWLCWLDSSPYYYRLLSTLGEDACNLLPYRLLWKKSPRS